MKKSPSNTPVSELSLAEFAENNIKKVVYKSVYNEKKDCSNRTFISYYTSANTRKEIPLRNISSRKEAIEYAYNYECSQINKGTVKVFNNEIKVGDKFLYNGKKNFLSEVVDILDCRSRVTGEIVSVQYIAKSISGLSTNRFDVSKVGIVRNRVD